MPFWLYLQLISFGAAPLWIFRYNLRYGIFCAKEKCANSNVFHFLDTNVPLNIPHVRRSAFLNMQHKFKFLNQQSFIRVNMLTTL